MMDQEPDRSEAHWQGNFATFDGANLFVCMVESISAAEGEPIPRTEVTRDCEGGWNVWIWRD